VAPRAERPLRGKPCTKDWALWSICLSARMAVSVLAPPSTRISAIPPGRSSPVLLPILSYPILSYPILPGRSSPALLRPTEGVCRLPLIFCVYTSNRTNVLSTQEAEEWAKGRSPQQQDHSGQRTPGLGGSQRAARELRGASQRDGPPFHGSRAVPEQRRRKRKGPMAAEQAGSALRRSSDQHGVDDGDAQAAAPAPRQGKKKGSPAGGAQHAAEQPAERANSCRGGGRMEVQTDRRGRQTDVCVSEQEQPERTDGHDGTSRRTDAAATEQLAVLDRAALELELLAEQTDRRGGSSSAASPGRTPPRSLHSSRRGTTPPISEQNDFLESADLGSSHSCCHAGPLCASCMWPWHEHPPWMLTC
jgi:hypothetical protein